MGDGAEILFVYCSCPDMETAGDIASELVGRKLAACVSQIPGVMSTYRWEGEVKRDEETMLVIKTRGDCYARLEGVLQQLHPYELPEIVAVPVVDGSVPYLAWIADNTAG